MFKSTKLYSKLSELNDTSISTPTNGQSLIYNSGSGAWVNSLPSISTSFSVNSLNGISTLNFDSAYFVVSQNPTGTALVQRTNTSFSPLSISTSNNAGTAKTAANADHTHEGTHSVVYSNYLLTQDNFFTNSGTTSDIESHSDQNGFSYVAATPVFSDPAFGNYMLLSDNNGIRLDHCAAISNNTQSFMSVYGSSCPISITTSSYSVQALIYTNATTPYGEIGLIANAVLNHKGSTASTFIYAKTVKSSSATFKIEVGYVSGSAYTLVPDQYSSNLNFSTPGWLDLTINNVGVYTAYFNGTSVVTGTISTSTVPYAGKAGFIGIATATAPVSYTNSNTWLLNNFRIVYPQYYQIGDVLLKNPYESDKDSYKLLKDPNSQGILVRGGYPEGFPITRSIVGTTNRISISNGSGVSNDPTIDISDSYVGQTSITTLGTISTGTWNASTILATYGGTGFNVYSTGDLLYADTTTHLNTLSINSSNNYTVLTSYSGLPAWRLPNITVGNLNDSSTYGFTTSVYVNTGAGLTFVGNYISRTYTTVTPTAISANALSGTDIRAANADHTHEGVHSITISNVVIVNNSFIGGTNTSVNFYSTGKTGILTGYTEQSDGSLQWKDAGWNSSYNLCYLDMNHGIVRTMNTKDVHLPSPYFNFNYPSSPIGTTASYIDGINYALLKNQYDLTGMRFGGRFTFGNSATNTACGEMYLVFNINPFSATPQPNNLPAIRIKVYDVAARQISVVAGNLDRNQFFSAYYGWFNSIINPTSDQLVFTLPTTVNSPYDHSTDSILVEMNIASNGQASLYVDGYYYGDCYSGPTTDPDYCYFGIACRSLQTLDYDPKTLIAVSEPRLDATNALVMLDSHVYISYNGKGDVVLDMSGVTINTATSSTFPYILNPDRGGTGLTSVGSAYQYLRTNGTGNSLEYHTVIPSDISASNNNESYLTLGNSSNLSSNRIFTPGNNLYSIDGGATSTYTIGMSTNVSTTGIITASQFSNDGFVSGGLVFSGAGNTITQNSSQIYWDNTNNKMGIGNNAPQGKLHIVGTADTTQLLIVGNATQSTYPILKIQDSRYGNTYFVIDGAGYAAFGTSIATSTGRKGYYVFSNNTNSNQGARDDTTHNISVTMTNAYGYQLQSHFYPNAVNLSNGYNIYALANFVGVNTGAITSRLCGAVVGYGIKGASYGVVGNAIGLFVDTLSNNGSGATVTFTNAHGIYINNQGPNGAGITFGTTYGIRILDQTGISGTQYALFTNAGINRFGDYIQIVGSQNNIQLRVQSFSTQTASLQSWYNTGTAVTASMSSAGKLFLGSSTAATAYLHLTSGQSAANSAPMKINPGVNLATPEIGAVEFDGTSLYLTNNASSRKTLMYTDESNISVYLTSADYFISTSADSYVITNTGLGTINLTLPNTGSISTGRKIRIADTAGTATTKPVYITSQGSDRINGITTYALTSNYQTVEMVYLLTNKWSIFA